MQNRKFNILFMDDDKESANGIIMHLKNEFNIELFLSTTHALEAVEKKGKTYDLLILDYDMAQEENGIAVLRKIKKNVVYYIPAILISAHIYSAQQVQEAMNAGFSQYFAKYDRNLIPKLRAAILELIAPNNNIVYALEDWVKKKPSREDTVMSEWKGKSYTVRDMLEKLKNNDTDADQRMRLVRNVIEFLVRESIKEECS